MGAASRSWTEQDDEPMVAAAHEEGATSWEGTRGDLPTGGFRPGFF